MLAVRVPLSTMADAELVAKAQGLTRRNGKPVLGFLLWDHSVRDIQAEAARLRTSLGLRESA